MQELISLEDSIVIDLKTIESIQNISNSQDLLTTLVHIFLEDSPQKITDLLEASSTNNSKTLYEVAHSLRSSSASLGAKRLAEICRFLEEQGRAGIIPDTHCIKLQLLKEYNDVKEILLRLIS